MMSSFGFESTPSLRQLAGFERHLLAGYAGQSDNTAFNTIFRIAVALIAIPAIATFLNVIQQLVNTLFNPPYPRC